MKSFKIEQRTNRGFEVLDLHGELDAHTASELDEALLKLIKNKKASIIVNFKGLDYIASAGLGVFMAYIEDDREMVGDIKLTNTNNKSYDVVDYVRFPALYALLEHVNIAVQKS